MLRRVTQIQAKRQLPSAIFPYLRLFEVRCYTTLTEYRVRATNRDHTAFRATKLAASNTSTLFPQKVKASALFINAKITISYNNTFKYQQLFSTCEEFMQNDLGNE